MTDPNTPAAIARLRELDAKVAHKQWVFAYMTPSSASSFPQQEVAIWTDLSPRHVWCNRGVYLNADDARLVECMRNALPALLDQLDAQAAEIERWRSDWKRIAADEAVWYTLSDIFGVEGMTNAAGVVSGVTEKWNERQDRVAKLEGLLVQVREECRLNGYWHLTVSDEVDDTLDKREGGR